jgi:ClpX C4-type zinc finger protein
MTIIESQGVEFLRIRVDHIERELAQIKTRLRALPLPEPTAFPVTPRTTPISQSQYYCTFCGKGQDEVVVLIAGPGPFICNECVTFCHEIVQKRLAKLEGETP